VEQYGENVEGVAELAASFGSTLDEGGPEYLRVIAGRGGLENRARVRGGGIPINLTSSEPGAPDARDNSSASEMPPWSFLMTVATAGCAMNCFTSAFVSGETRNDTTLDLMVGRSAPGSLEVRMMKVSAGGSSRSLRNAFAAWSDPVCDTIRSASPIT
jgi:hypothetical protein